MTGVWGLAPFKNELKIEFLFYNCVIIYKIKMETTKLQAGYQYLYDNNIITNFHNYQMTEQDINEKKISFLDKFHILSPDTEENIARNIDIKLELENIAKTGSCTGLAEYIFDLIIYTRGITNTYLNPSCSIS